MKEINQKITRKKEQILLASALSSVISTAITNPIQVAKLNFQYFPLSCRFYPHQNYLKLIRCECSKFSLKGSISSLKIAIPQVLFTNLIFMQLYEHLRETFIHKSLFNNSQSTFLSSILSRSVVVSLLIPFESLRIRLSNEVTNKKINFHGYKITLARDLTFSALYWTMLQSYRNTVVNGQYRQKIRIHQVFTWQNFMLNMLPGFLFGVVVSVITTPLDTLKTRIQSQGVTHYKIMKGIIEIYKREGWTGLLSGVQWRMLKSGLHSSLYLLIYEWYIKQVSFQDSFKLEE